MTLVQLEYIVAVDTYRSFCIAAEKCFITQPTMSMQVQKLEEDLGAVLFDRSRQAVVPTEIGIEILEQARIVLKESYKLKDIISNRKGEVVGELKIGVIPTLAPYLMPKVISAFIEKYPLVQLLIWEYNTEQIIHQLKNGLLECGIISTPVKDKSLHEHPLFYECFVAYLSKSSPLCLKKNISPKDFGLPTREIGLVTHRNFLKKQLISVLEQEILLVIPKRLQSKKKKEIIDIY